MSEASGAVHVTKITAVMEWLYAKAPGFGNLSNDERSAITDFSLLWGLFESRILNTNASANAICAVVEMWHANGALTPDFFDKELAYFKQRYHPQNEFTHHFGGLHLRPPDRVPMVRAVLTGEDVEPRHRAATALIIVYRYRNNLFHGLKWHYELADQLGNFNAANAVLMKALDRHGGLQSNN